jgi:TPR repeat protein
MRKPTLLLYPALLFAFATRLLADGLDDLKKLAERGDSKAQSLLAVSYQSGWGVLKDMAKAVEWYQKAAAQGDVTAQYNLGILYEKGIGVQKDNTQAAELFKKAARHGAAGPQFSLAACRP